MDDPFAKPRLDLTAPLIPGKSAAGFTIGTSRPLIEAAIMPVTVGRDPRDLRDNKGWMIFRYDRGDPVYWNYSFGDSVVQLIFVGEGPLSNIIVGEGYSGRYLDAGIGDEVRNLDAAFGLLFDDGDEEFYIGRDEIEVAGISFAGSVRASLEAAPIQTVFTMSVHDWELQRKG